jgi:hypothetical protein
MSITKEVVLDQVMVTTDGTLQCRQATRIMEDGKELTKTYHRFTLIPGQDLTDQPEKVVAIAQAAWTPEVVAAYEAAQLAVQPNP